MSKEQIHALLDEPVFNLFNQDLQTEFKNSLTIGDSMTCEIVATDLEIIWYLAHWTGVMRYVDKIAHAHQ